MPHGFELIEAYKCALPPLRTSSFLLFLRPVPVNKFIAEAAASAAVLGGGRGLVDHSGEKKEGSVLDIFQLCPLAVRRSK